MSAVPRERMAPAPALPPILAFGAFRAVKAEMKSAADPESGRALEALQAFSKAHTAYVESMADLHRKFLALQTSTAKRILSARDT